MQPRVYVGYDSRESDAYRACVNSMRARASVQPLVMPVSMNLLGEVYRRRTTRRNGALFDELSQEPMSTEFSLARFFVPKLARSGWALFCDCDFLWRCDVGEVFAHADPAYAVLVVKHRHEGGDSIKMDAQPQTYYARKNWSSLMLLNCDAPEWQSLTLEQLNSLHKHSLHGFSWIEEKRIGALPLDYNWLAGVSPDFDDPRVVHYTLGVPSMAGYERSPFAEEWRRYAGG